MKCRRRKHKLGSTHSIIAVSRIFFPPPQITDFIKKNKIVNFFIQNAAGASPCASAGPGASVAANGLSEPPGGVVRQTRERS